MRAPIALCSLALVSLLASAPATAVERPAAGASAQAWAASTDRIIVKYRETASTFGATPSIQALTERARRQTGLGLGHLRRLHNGVHVFRLPQMQDVGSMQALLQQLRQDPDVVYAEPDQRMFILRTPDDPRYGEQWHYHAAAGGMNLPAAWDASLGEGAVVAVVDTGVLPHAELKAQLLPGYDFISDATVANDGNGRDADASDPGDWTNASECGYNNPDRDYPSSWHGTHVAGTIAAASDNGLGVAGVAWKAKLLPVRVLGKCGGYTSDIVDGMRWAAGLPVPGAPTNANPAQVLNLSLGGSGSCSRTYSTAIAEIRAAGTSVVVAAGNSAQDASMATPANCAGVIAVAATDRQGGLAYYSNYGSTIDVSAPGGELYQGDMSGGILSTYNSGQNGAGGDSYGYLQGTSMAAPHVAGVVALMYAAKPTLRPDEVDSVLKSTARAFPVLSGSDRCTTSKCGSGIVDAAAAVAAVSGGVVLDETAPTVTITAPAQGAQVNGQVSLTAAASDDTGVSKVEFYLGDTRLATDVSAPYAYSWNSASVADGDHTLTVKAYDEAGNAGVAELTVRVANSAGGWSCREHYSSNAQHVSGGRASTRWYFMVYATGSQKYLGFNSAYSYSRLAETAKGHFEPGSCP